MFVLFFFIWVDHIPHRLQAFEALVSDVSILDVSERSTRQRGSWCFNIAYNVGLLINKVFLVYQHWIQYAAPDQQGDPDVSTLDTLFGS